MVIDKQIKIRTEVFIVSSLRITPGVLILPPSIIIKAANFLDGITYQLVAYGGSGNSFFWSSSATNVGIVSASGFVTSKNLGTSIITCYDSKDQENRDQINVFLILL